MSSNCPKCGTEIGVPSPYCPSCGAEVPLHSTLTLDKNTLVYKKCPVCGAENPETTQVCNECGIDFATGLISGGPGQGGLWHSLMVLDWKIRWASLAIGGILMGVVFSIEALDSGNNDIAGFALFFFLLGIIGVVATYMNLGLK